MTNKSTNNSKNHQNPNTGNSYPSNRERLRLKRWKRSLSTIIIGLVDLSLINVAVMLGYYTRFYLEIGIGLGWVAPVPVAPIKPYLHAIIFIDYIVLILFLLLNLYRRDRARWVMDEIRSIIRSLSIGFIIVTSLTFFARTKDFEYSRMVIFYSYLLSILLLSIWRFAVLRWEYWCHKSDKNISRVLIVGSGEMAQIVVRKLVENRGLGYKVIGFITPEEMNVRDLEGYPYLGDLDDFESIVHTHLIDEIFISETELSHFKLLEIVSTCELLGVLVKMVPRVYDLLIDFADMSDLDGLPLVAVREEVMYELNLLVKRLFDIAFSTIILILSFPFSIIIAISIKLDSKGLIIFTQRRAGSGGKPFNMYKFRTMHLDAESKLEGILDINDLDEPVFKIKDDPRITRVGRLLRRTSLDEIPQFWNVLKGNMSVVGPRPEETQLVDQYNIWQRRRLKIKPGITGMQQIACRGTTSLSDRVKFDIYYLRKHSILVDIWIILKTIPAVISGRGAY